MNKKLFLLILISCAGAASAFAQNFNYNPDTQELVISGSGQGTEVTTTVNTYKGNPIPGTDPVEYFGPTATVIIRDINLNGTNASLDPKSTNDAICKLENATYTTELPFEGGLVHCTLYIDENSTYNFTGMQGGTDAVYNQGTINATTNPDVGNYMFASEYDTWGVSMSGVLGGKGTVTVTDDPRNRKNTSGLILYTGPITNLQITGDYKVDATNGDGDSFGVNNSNSTTMSITGTLTVDAPNTAATGVYSGSLPGTNDYSGEINVTGTTATGIQSAAQINDLKIGILDVHATQGDAIGIVSGGDMKVTAASNAVINVNSDNETANVVAIKSGGSLTLATTDVLTVNAGIEAAGDIVIEKGTRVEFAQGTKNQYIKGNLTGAGANEFATNFYSIDPTGATALVGTYTPDENGKRIIGSIDDATLNSGSIKGEFIQNADNGVLGWRVDSNTYLQDNVAKTEQEKQIAALLDAAVSVDNGGEQDQATAAAKLEGAKSLRFLDVSTVAKLAYESTALAEDIYLDSFFRAGRILDTWIPTEDQIQGKLPERFQKSPSDHLEMSVRTINRFGTAGAKQSSGDFDYQTYGGMVNADKKLGKLLIGGGVGGWFSKIDNDAAGKAESDIIAVTAYVDWNFYDQFDWFTEVYYGHAMNTLKRNDSAGEINTDWDGNAIGGFTAIRYTYNILDTVAIKPFIGAMITYNMQDSFSENGGKFNFAVDSKDYTNVKGVVGIEGAWQPIESLYISARVMYAYEFADNEYDMSFEMMGWGRSHYRAYETDRSSVVAGIGVNYQLTKSWNIGVNYNAEIRSSELNNNINASVGFRW